MPVNMDLSGKAWFYAKDVSIIKFVYIMVPVQRKSSKGKWNAH